MGLLLNKDPKVGSSCLAQTGTNKRTNKLENEQNKRQREEASVIRRAWGLGNKKDTRWHISLITNASGCLTVKTF